MRRWQKWEPLIYMYNLYLEYFKDFLLKNFFTFSLSFLITPFVVTLQQMYEDTTQQIGFFFLLITLLSQTWKAVSKIQYAVKTKGKQLLKNVTWREHKMQIETTPYGTSRRRSDGHAENYSTYRRERVERSTLWCAWTML